MIPIAHDPVSDLAQVVGTPCVFLSLFGMLPAVKFHDKTTLRTTKIYDEPSQRMLAAEFEPVQITTSQVPPKQTFRVGLIAAKVPGV
jgi:hypothetical protein